MEDVVVLEAQQIRIETDRADRKEVGIKPDAGFIAARRILDRLIQEETSAQFPTQEQAA
jgi:hypothetical protein